MKNHFVEYLKIEIINAYGENPKLSPDFPRIINKKNWQRLVNKIDTKKVIFGGQTDIEDYYISPTLIEENSLDTLIMQDEIFGPLLPILTYKNETEINTILSKYEKPLAFYIFTDDKKFAERIITKHSFGGGCINETIMHFSNSRLPFGGVGHSGIGAYHGRFSFDTFSHHKGVTKKGTWLDLPLRYAPYSNKLDSIKKIVKWL